VKVSVILTTYNRAEVLAGTIDDVLRQSFRDFELIICDDCSTDNTAQICRDYEQQDSRVSYQRNKKNLGMPGNLYAGIISSSGEYIANLHDGDVYDTKLLEKWVAALDACPNAGFVFNAYGTLNPNGKFKVIYKEPLPACAPGSVLLEEIYFRRWHFDSPVWGTVMGRRKAYEEVGLFEKRFGFTSDVDMWMRLAELFSVAYINEPLILLPCREKLPREISLNEKNELRIAQRMFLEARVRHYKRRPFRLFFEISRHICFVVANRIWIIALRTRRRLLNFADSTS